MKKKILSLFMLSIITISSFTGCVKLIKNSEDQTKQSVTETNKKEDMDKKTIDKDNKSPVKISDIELIDFKVREADSIGTIYMEAKFKNNSNQTIIGLDFTYEVDGEKTYLTSYDTLLPGDTSTLSDTFGPISGKQEDAKFLKAQITIMNDDNTETYIEYDPKLNIYKQY